MFKNFPVGQTQVLGIGDLTLTLTETEFNGDGDAGDLGYQRIEDIAQQVTATDSLYGTPILEGQLFPPKYLFRWSLFLTRDQLFLLKALYDEQHNRFRTGQDGRILLQDQRLIFMEKQPRRRAAILPEIVEPAAPSGFTFFAAQFYILLELGSDFASVWGMPTAGDIRHEVAIAARELDIVPPALDI